jgi:CTP synthase (UTP-ammonia lyase)
VKIAIVGDRDDSKVAHRAIPVALAAAAQVLALDVVIEWVPTEAIADVRRIASFDAFWVAPGSPYRSLEGALLAIQHARVSGVPFLGTCGGFQHAILEYARHVLGWEDARHAESDPGVGRPVISALACALVEVNASVDLVAGSRIASIYDSTRASAGYRCSYGLNPAFRSALVGGALRESARDEAGEMRALEIEGHPFFVATLWQPERAALAGERVPLAEALLVAARAGCGRSRV